MAIGPRGGKAPLFKKDGDINPKLLKEAMNILGPEREQLIQQKEDEFTEVDRLLQENQEVVNNENEELSVRERARKKVLENT